MANRREKELIAKNTDKIHYSFFGPTAPPVSVLGNFSSPMPARSDIEPAIRSISTIVDPAKRTKGLKRKSVSNYQPNHEKYH